MSSELQKALLSAVSPFDLGVAPLTIRALRTPEFPSGRPTRTAAVLVPILDKNEPEIILTVRSQSLVNHPGQVSFPGGSVDQTDRSAISTALREAEEEIGLAHSQVTPVGFLDRLDTISDYRVLPVVGLVSPPFDWQPDIREVSEVFTVPLAMAIDRSAYDIEAITQGSETMQVSVLHWQGHKIWGVTAAILLNLAARMHA